VKLKLEGSKIRASLEDEGKNLVMEVSLSLRHEEGRILPVLAFEKPPEGSGQAAASIQRRIVRLLGPVHVAAWGRRPTPLSLERSSDEASGASSFPRMQTLPKLPRL
jgi:hypothetical protein